MYRGDCVQEPENFDEDCPVGSKKCVTNDGLEYCSRGGSQCSMMVSCEWNENLEDSLKSKLSQFYF